MTPGRNQLTKSDSRVDSQTSNYNGRVNAVLREWENALRVRSIADRDEELQSRCAGKRVLHLGCTDSPFTLHKLQEHSLLHLKLETVAQSIVGVDIDGVSLDAMRPVTTRKSQLVLADLQEPGLADVLKAHEFDVVVCADVIEHLDSPGRMLSNIAALLAPQTQVVITTINAYAAKLFVRGLMNREAVHPDHVSYYSFATLKHLTGRFGIKLEEQYLTFRYPLKNRFLSNFQAPLYKLFPAIGDGLFVTGYRA